MWNTPQRTNLQKIPGLNQTEHIPIEDKIVHEHFFIGGSDWYIIEYDGNGLFWGFAILNGDIQNAEFGYISFDELKKVKVGFTEVDCDMYWQPKPVKEVEAIMKARRRLCS
jgi:hypothetical protein